MNAKQKLILQDWIFIMLAWMFIMNLYSVVVIWGLDSLVDWQALQPYDNSWMVYLEPSIFGLIFGFFFALINTLSEQTFIRKKSFSFIILIKSLLYLVSLIIVYIIFFTAYTLLGILPEEIFTLTIENLDIRIYLSITIYFVFFIFIINFLVLINKKFGPGNLWNFVTGKYHTPKKESRLFMFLDLKGSTTIAEQLGHFQYSKLLQYCFHDITDIVIKYNAEIYQYVGDEVVLTWSMENGLKNLNFIKLFFEYEKKLASRRSVYFSKFGVFPVFKAGIEMGEVTVAEVGEIKREIAYHGDVLNTAARIQERCNEFHHNILISEHLQKEIMGFNHYKTELMGNIQLRGKQNPLKILAVIPNESLN
ncbi:adenylate/guanylate cyclase domain-containing protein [Flexithrix dorotheae]|uniref:adenylate/guanylate cyclase domain-containing protein n=1 Tax=Flexithrix dorotheae TaxID=70993 RepID=UPI0003641590|nr:adenylate/guanylate cyclase domain-containing protein [Flexithrix dorotheae]